MEINTTIALFGTQIISSLGLFWAVTNSFHKEINEVKKEINEVENKLNIKIDSKFEILSKEISEVKGDINEVKVEQANQAGEIHRLADKILFVYSFLPIPKLAAQPPLDS